VTMVTNVSDGFLHPTYNRSSCGQSFSVIESAWVS